MSNMDAGSFQAGELERAIIAGVRAALQDALPRAAGPGMAVPTRQDNPPVTAASSGLGCLISAGTSQRQEEINLISKEVIEHLLLQGMTRSEVASALQISRPTLYKYMREYNIRRRFSDISDQELDSTISAIKTEHPHVRELMLNGHLRARNIIVQRRRLRNSVKRVDSTGVQSRRMTTIHRRVYSVPFPNYIWHIDGNHKLIRWKLVVHCAMDGYSRMLTFLLCSNNNKAETAMELFSEAISKFGRPLHIRTDYGGENVLIWEDMRFHRGENSVLTGSSVHNQRIERFNRDLNRNCRDVFAPTFYELESTEALDVENETDLFCLHYVYIPRINKTVHEFKSAFNNHSVSSEGSRTPAQLFELDRVFPNIQGSTTEEIHYFRTEQTYRFCPLNEQDLHELSTSINPLENDGNKGKALYHRVQEFVFNKLTNM